tara:strand:+ start:1332 stop:1529 length:198 start_codon:yes stop_codon:yes gene_type:complete
MPRIRILCKSCERELPVDHSHIDNLGDIVIDVIPCKKCQDCSGCEDMQTLKKLKEILKKTVEKLT